MCVSCVVGCGVAGCVGACVCPAAKRVLCVVLCCFVWSCFRLFCILFCFPLAVVSCFVMFFRKSVLCCGVFLYALTVVRVMLVCLSEFYLYTNISFLLI